MGVHQNEGGSPSRPTPATCTGPDPPLRQWNPVCGWAWISGSHLRDEPERSARKEERNGAARQKVSGGPAEQDLRTPGSAVSPDHQTICADLSDLIGEDLRCRPIRSLDGPDLGRNFVTLQMLKQFLAGRRSSIVSLNRDNRHGLRRTQEGQRIRDSAARFTTSVPGHRNMIADGRSRPGIRNKKHRNT